MSKTQSAAVHHGLKYLGRDGEKKLLKIHGKTFQKFSFSALLKIWFRSGFTEKLVLQQTGGCSFV